MGRYTLHPSKTIHPGKLTAGTQFHGALEDCFPFHFGVIFRFQPLIFRGVPTKLESTNLNYFFWDDHLHSRGKTDLQVFIFAVFSGSVFISSKFCFQLSPKKHHPSRCLCPKTKRRKRSKRSATYESLAFFPFRASPVMGWSCRDHFFGDTHFGGSENTMQMGHGCFERDFPLYNCALFGLVIEWSLEGDLVIIMIIMDVTGTASLGSLLLKNPGERETFPKGFYR